jgi:Recombinase
MPRQKTGRPLGRPPVYQDEEERPVTVSLRIPHDLAAQMKRYASLHRQSVTELLLDGLRWRIGDGDPRGLSIPVLQQTAHDNNAYYGNTEVSSDLLRETAHTAILEEIRTALASQATQLQALTQALEQRPMVSMPDAYYGNTIKAPIEQQSTPEPVRKGRGERSNTVLQEDGNTAARDTSAQQPDIPDKAALVARLHQMRASGLSLSQIAGQLQAEGLPTLSGKGQWQKGTVDKLLHKQAKRQSQPA